MDVKIPLTKLVIAFFVLRILADRKRNHADPSAFFARQKWTLVDACELVGVIIGLVFGHKVLVPLWFPWNTPGTLYWGSVEYPTTHQGCQEIPRSATLGELS